jgi:hypothetical protein
MTFAGRASDGTAWQENTMTSDAEGWLVRHWSATDPALDRYFAVHVGDQKEALLAAHRVIAPRAGERITAVRALPAATLAGLAVAPGAARQVDSGAVQPA